MPSLSPIQSAFEQGHIGTIGKAGVIPDVASLRIPVQYLANLLSAGDEKPVIRALGSVYNSLKVATRP